MTNGAPADMVGHFRLGLDVLKQYPALALPPLAAQAIVFVLAVLFVGGAATAVAVGGGAGVLGAVGEAMLLGLVAGLLSLVASGVTIVMARDALGRREPVMGDAFGAVMGRMGDVVIASILVTVIVMIGMVLLVLPGLVAGFFLMFTLPAVLLDGAGALESLKKSAGLVKDNLGTAIGLVIGIVVAGVAVWIVSLIVGHVPILGQLVSAILAGVFMSYLSVVAVSVYQTLPGR
jgi:hypothetical protein